MKANDLSRFRFQKVSSGAYRVTYTPSDKSRYYYTTVINDMPLIDATYLAEWAKLKDIQHLRRLCLRAEKRYYC